MSKKIVIPIAIIFLIMGGAVAYIVLHKNPAPIRQKSPQATIKQLPTSKSSIDDKQVGNSASKSQGTATNISTVTSSSTTPISSASGVITVNTPAMNSTIQNGAVLSGKSSLSKIQYRLIDDAVGVISQGPVTVTNDVYSVSMSFKSQATTGRLDIYSTDDGGSEVNEVQIAVKY